jgi:hypothetical protein
MPDIRLNSLKNRLYITLKNWDQINRYTYVQNIESACRTLVFGFTCLIVLKKNGMIRQKDKDLLFSTADLISAYGAAKVVIVKKTGKSTSMFERSPLSIHSFFRIKQALNIKEAENILDEEITPIRPLKTFQPKEARTN